MTIDEAIEQLNEVSKYFVWNPDNESPLFEKSKRKGKVECNQHFDSSSDECDFSFDEIITTASQIQSSEILGKGFLRTKSFVFQIIKPINKQAIAYSYRMVKEKIKTSIEGIEISIESSSLIHSMAAIKELNKRSLSELDYHNLLVQINFNKETFTNEYCIHLINSFLFELENSYKLNFLKSDYKGYIPVPFDNMPEIKEIELVNTITKEISNKSLIKFNSRALELFLDSKQTDNEEIKLILLYKVFEYFGPIVIKLEVHENLSKKLKDSRVKDPDSAFLTSIVNLVTNYNKRNNDWDMLKEVFKSCIDIEIIKDEIPNFLSKKISSKTNFSQLKVNIAKSLYSTRNSIVHAKSNYKSDGNECKSVNLKEFNEFLSTLAAQTIDWWNTLPKHQK